MRDQIPALVKQNIFLSDEVKQNILSQYETLEEEQITKILGLLNRSLESQNSLLEKALKKDPTILSRAHQMLKNEIRKVLQEKEEVSRHEEEKELEDLESELDSLFD